LLLRINLAEHGFYDFDFIAFYAFDLFFYFCFSKQQFMIVFIMNFSFLN